MASREKKFKPRGMPVKRVKPASEQEDQHQVIRDSPQKQRKEEIHNDDNMEFLEKTDKQSLALQIIRNGYVQSYIDFFHITQPEEIEGSYHVELNEEQLLRLKESLQIAEQASRYHSNNKLQAIQEYYQLANLFFGTYQDYNNAAYFYKRVIYIAKDQNEYQLEGQGNLGCGKCYQYMDRTDEAINILEKSLREAEEKRIMSLAQDISSQLIEIYKKRAQQYEKGETVDIDQALVYYEKCLTVSRKLKDNNEEGDICYKIGLLYFKNNEFEVARDYQKKYLEITKDDQREKNQKQIKAHAAIAKCYIKLNQTDDALHHLQQYYQLASNDRNAKSDAALHLATLHSQKGDIEKSNVYYKEHFKEAKDEKADNKNRKLVDRARVTVGIALANSTIDKHIDLVKNSDKNLKALLDWKCKKMDGK